MAPAAFPTLFLIVIGLWIACLLTATLFLFSWTQRDIADGRFQTRPAQSAAMRFLPGLVLVSMIVLPASGIREVLFMSGFMYLPLALMAELLGSISGRLHGEFPPPLPVVNVTATVSTFAAIFGIVFVAIGPPIANPVAFLAVGALLIGLAAFSLVLARVGTREETERRPLWRSLLPFPLRPRETFALYVTAGLDLVVVAFVVWVIGLYLR